VENTKVAWSHNTHNEWIGCTKCSPGCLNCYAARRGVRFPAQGQWGKGKPRGRTSLRNRNKPYAWDRKAAASGEKIKVFCSSLSDVFDDDDASPMDEWRAELFEKIEKTPNLYWLLLTKRPQNVMSMVPAGWASCLPKHVWIGTTAEDQKRLDERAPILAEIPATVRFLSCEPLLGPLDLTRWLYRNDSVDGSPVADPKINWVITGGESGPGFREIDIDWVKKIRDQCVGANVPFFFKQGSGLKPEAEPELDGRRWTECPEERFALGV
jgi:protein gp37